MRKACLYVLGILTAAGSGYLLWWLAQRVFFYESQHWNDYPVVTLILMMGFSFLVFAGLSVAFLLTATVKGGIES